jgi:hypothetical protein
MQLWGPGDSDNQRPTHHTRLLIQTSESRSVQYRPRALIRASTRSGQSNQRLHWDAMNLRVGLSHRDDESDERFDTNSPRTHEEEPGMHSNHLYILVTPLILQITFEQVFPECAKSQIKLLRLLTGFHEQIRGESGDNFDAATCQNLYMACHTRHLY